MSLINLSPQKIEIDQRWHWQWGDWLSGGFEELEERPWTPLVIDNKLCFVAFEKDKRLVVWGDNQGKDYDDVYDTINFKDTPLYIAREGQEFF